MSKTDWTLMNLVDKELYEALGLESRDWKFRMSPCGLINAARREKKPDVFCYLREAVGHTLLEKYIHNDDKAETVKNKIHAYSVFIEENENLKKFLDS